VKRLLFLAAFLVAALGVMIGLTWTQAQTYPVRTLATQAPERTALMRQREREAARLGKPYRVDHRWVPYARIAPILRRAVLAAEDDAFFAHGGLDWNEIQASARENWKKRRIARGGSTITQQLAKNLFLGDARTPWRKLTELFVALRLERELTKKRIFELYLNSIEWGDGVFGIEAAARRHFGVPASSLSPRQAVLLAAVIINPRRYSPTEPNRRIQKRARTIASRLRRRGVLDAEQYQVAIGAPAPDTAKKSFTDWFFGVAPDTAPPAEVPETPPVEGPPVEVPSESLPPAPPPDSSG
jgi:monofunctional biosynthetic peptidoglycan transglycosylase